MARQAICGRCEYNELCKARDYLHPLTKLPLPKVSNVVYDAIELYNNRKLGVNYTKTELDNIPNKTYVILLNLSSYINEKEMNKFKEKQ